MNPRQELNYLNCEHTLRSWFLTTDHKRVAILFAATITMFFFIGGGAATLIRLELATPQGDLVSSDVYNRLFSMHGIVMVWFFLIPSIPTTLGNFMRWQKLQPKVLIIDNESTEASRAALREFIGADQLVCSATNLGYSGGNNLGIEHALAAGCEYILLLNADADLPEDSARRLLKRLEENPQVSILGPVIVEAPHGWDQPLAGGRDIARHVFTRVKLRRDRIKRLRDYPLRAVDYVPGTVFLARAELFRDTGLLDEKYFFSGEIADLCKRASAKAQGICIDLEVEVRHRPEAAAANSRAVL